MKYSSSIGRGLTIPPYFPFAFPLSGKARSLGSLSGLWPGESAPGGMLAPSQARTIVARILEQGEIGPQSSGLSPGRLLAVNTILRAQRFLLWQYCAVDCPKRLDESLSKIDTEGSSKISQVVLPLFAQKFPPMTIVAGKSSQADYMRGSVGGTSNKEIISAELILFDVTGDNAAILRPLSFLIDDAELRGRTEFKQFIARIEELFNAGPPVPALNATLIECLRAPAKACPDSLEGQLEYIREHWAGILPADILNELLLTLSITKEEAIVRTGGPGPSRILQFDKSKFSSGMIDFDEERFSHDAEWMPNVVLLAKSVYVWLNQLSQEFQRDIRTLSDIPDETLDQLAEHGFTGLWLIGLWQRSGASQKIKQMSGNPEAAASAYSLYDYVIAEDLGGESSFENLRDRCQRRGLRLASDMVPNHTGIYSKWVVEHPDWFVQLSSPPYPGYRFSGDNLSDDDRVLVQIEDGYWDKRDAAVVFKRTDSFTGDVRYIYHGNDGTNMPWNDTAQLDFTLAEVREAVIQTILHVARHFPIIRFDAAMILTRRHFRRLWFPPPGEGGAIPSRSEHGLSDDEFDALFPVEFWREVVDRITAEQPDTLLLAEAFWLMEGYFVRTLGMHRVYNSAFMNMLKLEENDKYRTTIKNVLEFSPAILGRFVNFMNNPDEETAVEQFGRQDKYFGVATLLVTMPGLPMFGHGQVEGFTEKYGMEYRRAYRDERPDTGMITRHERQIFPLMRKRYLFSGWRNFVLYDFVTDNGHVDENVFAYSNGNDNERTLVIYNNAYTETSGRIKLSTPINTGASDSPELRQRSLAEALGIHAYVGTIYRFRDHMSGLEYLRTGSELFENGLFAELHAYTCHVFLDFAEVDDHDSLHSRLMTKLSGAGTPSIDKALTALKYEPVLTPFCQLLADIAKTTHKVTFTAFPESTPELISAFYSALASFKADEISSDKIAILSANSFRACEQLLVQNAKEKQANANALAGWAIVREIGVFSAESGDDTDRITAIAQERYNDWLLSDQVASTFSEPTAQLLRLLLRYERFFVPVKPTKLSQRLDWLLKESEAQQYLLINDYESERWLNKERFETLILSLSISATILNDATTSLQSGVSQPKFDDEARRILSASERANYNVDRIVEQLKTVE